MPGAQRYDAIPTDDADKALKLVRAWQPDLVLIDMHLADEALSG